MKVSHGKNACTFFYPNRGKSLGKIWFYLQFSIPGIYLGYTFCKSLHIKSGTFFYPNRGKSLATHPKMNISCKNSGLEMDKVLWPNFTKNWEPFFIRSVEKEKKGIFRSSIFLWYDT